MISQSLSLPIITPTLGAPLRRAMAFLDSERSSSGGSPRSLLDSIIVVVPDAPRSRLVASAQVADNAGNARVVAPQLHCALRCCACSGLRRPGCRGARSEERRVGKECGGRWWP